MRPLVEIYKKKKQLTRFIYVFVIVNLNRPENIRKNIKESLVSVFNVRLNYLSNYIYLVHLEYTCTHTENLPRNNCLSAHKYIQNILIIHNVYCIDNR